MDNLDSPKGTANVDSTIFLNPIPSDSAADSLNWSAFRKWNIMILLGLSTGVGLSVENFLGNLAPDLYQEFPDEPTSAIHRLLNVIVPMVAPGALIFVSLGVVYGRRLSLLLSMVILCATSLWAGLTTSFQSLYAARIIQGLACGPTDALFLTVIQDCTFVHERGHMLGAVVMLQLALQAALSIAVTYVTIHTNLRWTFIVYACLAAFCVVWMFLVMPETRRDRFHQEGREPTTVAEHHQIRQNLPAMTLKESLAAGHTSSNGAGHEFGLLVRQLLIALTRPTNWWCILLTTVTTGAYIGYCNFFATILIKPPYSWPSANVGLINLTVFPAAFLNWLITGWASDRMILRYVRGNTEAILPEYRLIPLLFPALCAIAGHIGFGCLAEHYLVTNPGGPQAHWFAMAVISCLQYIGFGGVLEVVLTFLGSTIDPDASLATMTAVTVCRDIAAFGISYGTFDFSTNVGYAASFGIYAMLIGVLLLGAIPIVIFGVRAQHTVH
ncbi:major facilitator superfamily domain-containing protein [Aspergillus sergii]|uniref:Major facilitator superfamily domain-containing protein n=1 Tax=Aspergillus sergii TaxID=1034303 RepID=A0A5N6XJL4_9EURO|nr:major facilitator superfamily domain-containing protein [Aspergillus sergii]